MARNLIPISVLELAAGLHVSLLWKVFHKAAMEVVDFAVDFLVAKCAEKIRRKICRVKTKNRRHTTPPNPQARPKTAPQNLPTNPPVKPPSTRRAFSIEKACFWRRLQSMHSGTLFGCLVGMVEAPMLKCTCNPSAAAGGRDKVCCARFHTTLLVKSVRLEKTAQKEQKVPPRDFANSGSPRPGAF